MEPGIFPRFHTAINGNYLWIQNEHYNLVLKKCTWQLYWPTLKRQLMLARSLTLLGSNSSFASHSSKWPSGKRIMKGSCCIVEGLSGLKHNHITGVHYLLIINSLKLCIFKQEFKNKPGTTQVGTPLMAQKNATNHLWKGFHTNKGFSLRSKRGSFGEMKK